jgi:hypothetical protein
MENKHLDPPRYPKLILPIENGMKKQFELVSKKIIIDITKQLTKEVKQK